MITVSAPTMVTDDVATTPELRRLEWRVARGAAALDRHVPGWRERVDPRTLDVRFTNRCVLGQVFGDYNSIDAWLFLERVDLAAWQLGLDVFNESYHVFATLTWLWQRELRSSRGEARRGRPNLDTVSALVAPRREPVSLTARPVRLTS